ncbi:MAG: phosphoribosylformylglycinamidine synthase [Kiritimatiellia bacterium]|jgi:phosphoribosylformylglycinamidine synthase
MDLTILAGRPAFSGFRIDALASRLAAIEPRLANATVSAHFVYLLDLAAPLDALSRSRVEALLEARAFEKPGCAFFHVMPRKGTLSPWASKAYDIFTNCGLSGSVRRVERGVLFTVRDAQGKAWSAAGLGAAAAVFFDRMTEGIYDSLDGFFDRQEPARGRVFDVLARGRDALVEANQSMGLALSGEEIDYLLDVCRQAGRNPTDTELVTFGQVNSEHCRHKIFTASWTKDGRPLDLSLFQMIRHTHAVHPDGTLVAYSDNAGVLEGFDADTLRVDGDTRAYRYVRDRIDLVIKVETHNHPTAISPFPGAATGVGGEIRDETATGVGGKSKAGVCGFMVSNLRVPGYVMPWETPAPEFPGRLATPLDIMLDGPLGGAAFGNEFGRPQLCGFFRTYEQKVAGTWRGFHKPVMLAGGMGNIRRGHIKKQPISPGDLIVQLGGPALRIGLGGGAASSMATGSNDAALDFDSVQRGNAEMERRCQEVIDTCTALGSGNPILAIHDIGAGGLSNGCLELVEKTGARFDLRAVPNEEPSMSPMEIWCCEAQERYVLAIHPQDRDRFFDICRRERCPAAVIGVASGDRRLVLHDPLFGDNPIDMDIRALLGNPPRMSREVGPAPVVPPALDLDGVEPADAFQRILRLPAVANKNFLVTITDRSVTGLVHRDQLVGPFQLPVADNAVTATGYLGFSGEAMSTGERAPVAVVDAPASGRLAVGEALTNLAGAPVGPIGNVKLSGNWMCACGEPGEDAALRATVESVAMDLCPALGISIPVGKDSLSMRTLWEDSKGGKQRQVAPLSFVATAFSPVSDVRLTLAPDLKADGSRLLLVDLGLGRGRLGGSALAQVYGQAGDTPPDLDDPALFRGFFAAMQEIVARRLALSYHDRSDGGVAVTLAEMAMAGGRGISADLPSPGASPLAALFSEELGAVLEVAPDQAGAVLDVFRAHGLGDAVRDIGASTPHRHFRVAVDGVTALDEPLARVRSAWSELTCKMQEIRDNPACAREEFAIASDAGDPGMTFSLAYDPDAPCTASIRQPPRIAILREQGVNGQVEMAAAFTRAGFDAVDVHMSDLHAGSASLDAFDGLVACGGFSYGDVLGSGAGWARSILFSPRLEAMFRAFFERPGTFTLGVCNGCQMVSQLAGLIPGTQDWPRFGRNRSGQFEARYTTVEVLDSPSILLRGMAGSRIPISLAHGEGRTRFASEESAARLAAAHGIALRYVDTRGLPTEVYPYNPSGSAGGATGFTSADGRVTIMMPHPERGFRSIQLPYRPDGLFVNEDGPWMRMFRNAYDFVARRRRS